MSFGVQPFKKLSCLAIAFSIFACKPNPSGRNVSQPLSGSTAADTSGNTQSGTLYAPYVPTWGGNTNYSTLSDLRKKTGITAVTVAFALSPKSKCEAWFDWNYDRLMVNEFMQEGGLVRASFGGAAGSYLETACKDSDAVTDALERFVKYSNIIDLDFDIEQPDSMTDEINSRRADAIAKLQKRNSRVRVGLTLAVRPRVNGQLPAGITPDALRVLKSFVRAGVKISLVNLMTMDYGIQYAAGNAMGDAAISALTEANLQLRSVFSGLTEADAWKMLGVTPMIGQNDVPSEKFTLADAKKLVQFAKQNKLGGFFYWDVSRDDPLKSNQQARPFEFHEVFKSLRN